MWYINNINDFDPFQTLIHWTGSHFLSCVFFTLHHVTFLWQEISMVVLEMVNRVLFRNYLHFPPPHCLCPYIFLHMNSLLLSTPSLRLKNYTNPHYLKTRLILISSRMTCLILYPSFDHFIIQYSSPLKYTLQCAPNVW